MKKFLIAGVAFAALSGCLPSPPQTSDEMRKAVRGGAMFSEYQTTQINRSYSAVTASIRNGAAKCLNRNFEQRSTYSPGPGMAPTTQITRIYYKTDIKARGNMTEVAVHRRYGNGGRTILGQEMQGLSYLIDITPSGRGAKVETYGGTIGYGALDKAVLQWARGGSTRCPDLP